MGVLSRVMEMLLVHEVDRQIGLIRDIAKRIEDPRQVGKVRHSVPAMLRQGVMSLIAG